MKKKKAEVKKLKKALVNENDQRNITQPKLVPTSKRSESSSKEVKMMKKWR